MKTNSIQKVVVDTIDSIDRGYLLMNEKEKTKTALKAFLVAAAVGIISLSLGISLPVSVTFAGVAGLWQFCKSCHDAGEGVVGKGLKWSEKKGDKFLKFFGL